MLLQTCTTHPPQRLPEGYVQFARAIETEHGIGIKSAEGKDHG